MTNLNHITEALLARLEQVKAETPSAGTKFRLMGVAADITELSQQMQQDVLERMSREAVLDTDIDIDYAELYQQVLGKELDIDAEQEEVKVQQMLVNEALDTLSDIIAKIAAQQARHHHDEEYARLYEQENRRYMNSGTGRRSRQTFEEWRENSCNGQPSLEDIEDYRMEKVLQMFEKGVFNARVEHIQRAKRYPDELDFDQLEDDHKLKKTAHRHYSVLRRMVDYKDGSLVVNPVNAGRHFYASRHDENAKAHRNAFLKYMHKISMVQEERQKMLTSKSADEAPKGQKTVVPDKLRGERADAMMLRLAAGGLLDAAWQPNGLSGAERGLLAKAVADRLDISDVWQVFGSLWGDKPETLRRYFNNALDQRKSLEYQEKLKKILG